MWSPQRALRIAARAVITLPAVVLEALLLLYAVHAVCAAYGAGRAPAPLATPPPTPSPADRAPLAGAACPPGFLRAHRELCPRNGAGVPLVILIASAPGNRGTRRAIRKSWGPAARRAGVVLGFALGVPPAGARTSVRSEDALRRDIIQGRYRDTHANLALKSVSMLKWVSAHCARAARLLKVDDDMFVNVAGVLRFAARHPANNTLWGASSEVEALQDPRDRYFAAGAGRLPPFLVGSYLVAGDAVRRLARAADAERLLRQEDVFVTGLAARRARARLRHAPWFLRRGAHAPGCDAARWLVVRVRRGRDHGALHQLLTNKRYRCVVSPPY